MSPIASINFRTVPTPTMCRRPDLDVPCGLEQPSLSTLVKQTVFFCQHFSLILFLQLYWKPAAALIWARELWWSFGFRRVILTKDLSRSHWTEPQSRPRLNLSFATACLEWVLVKNIQKCIFVNVFYFTFRCPLLLQNAPLPPMCRIWPLVPPLRRWNDCWSRLPELRKSCCEACNPPLQWICAIGWHRICRPQRPRVSGGMGGDWWNHLAPHFLH